MASLENDLTVRAKTSEVTVADFASGSYATIFRDEVSFQSKSFLVFLIYDFHSCVRKFPGINHDYCLSTLWRILWYNWERSIIDIWWQMLSFIGCNTIEWWPFGLYWGVVLVRSLLTKHIQWFFVIFFVSKFYGKLIELMSLQIRRRIKQVPLAFYQVIPPSLFSDSDFPGWTFGIQNNEKQETKAAPNEVAAWMVTVQFDKQRRWPRRLDLSWLSIRHSIEYDGK